MSNMNPNPNPNTPRQHSYHTSHDYQGSSAPGINIQHATPQGNQYSGGGVLPGSLQPGRPQPTSSVTASSSVPTLPPLQNTNQPSSSSRPPTTGQSHGYSRSSPAGFDHPKYAPFVGTPESAKYATPSHKHSSSRSGGGDSIYSPLGLADIRSFNETGAVDPQSASPFGLDGLGSFPTHNNYFAPWPVYAFDWCKWPVQNQNIGESAGKMALGSYVEDGHNYIQILETRVSAEKEQEEFPDLPPYGIEYVKSAEATHSYPVTRILWEPASSQKQSTDLLATSGDHLRLWSLPAQQGYNSSSNSITRSASSNVPAPGKLTALALLSNSKSPEHTAPLTSLDWNTVSPSLIITSSIDTTCTIWDIPTLTAKTQLIAHDKEVFDVRFCANSVDVFVSCGADGSVRMFDLRSLEHSTIIYEPTEKAGDNKSSPGNLSPSPAHQTLFHSPPLLRLAASPHDAHLLATFSQDSPLIRILDVRQPGQALLELRGHSASLNCIEWSPSRRGTLASGGDDSLVLIWDLLNQNGSIGGSSSTTTTNLAASNANGTAGKPPAPPPPAGAAPAAENLKSLSPLASWQCEYEVSNLSWAPQSALTAHSPPGSDWLAVSGGRGIWGVCM